MRLRHTPIEKRIPAVRHRFFPGWKMLAIAAAAQFMSGPGQSYSVAAFKDPMRTGLGISETNYSLAYGFATLVSGLCLPFIGRIVDRFGARRILPIIACLLGLACFWMSHITTLAELYLSFSMLRSLGQGALTLIAMWIVGEWFCRRRGFAAALAGLGGSLSVMTLPLLNDLLIRWLDWQTGWIVLGIAVWVVIIPAAVVILRDRPEDLGLYPDGISPEAADTITSGVKLAASPDLQPIEYSWTIGQVVCDVTFWKLISVAATSGLVITGLMFHQVALLGSRGVTPTWALGMISFQAVIATVCSLPTGWLTDRVAGRYLLSVAMVFLAAASCVVLVMPVVQLVILYATLIGLHGAILRSAGSVIWLNYYGRGNQGTIRGVAMSVMILAAALGPLSFAFSIDHFGSYNPALWLFIAMPIAAAATVFTARPRHRQESDAGSVS